MLRTRNYVARTTKVRSFHDAPTDRATYDGAR
jgi:hypothetical protein